MVAKLVAIVRLNLEKLTILVSMKLVSSYAILPFRTPRSGPDII